MEQALLAIIDCINNSIVYRNKTYKYLDIDGFYSFYEVTINNNLEEDYTIVDVTSDLYFTLINCTLALFKKYIIDELSFYQ